MKKLTIWVLFALLITIGSLTSCATVGDFPDLAKRIPGTVNAVCDLYAKVKPHYPQVRAAAIALHERGVLDGDVWDALVEFDAKTPELDRNLSLLCELAAGAPVGHLLAAENANTEKWDQLATIVLKVAGTALQFKAQGLI